MATPPPAAQRSTTERGTDMATPPPAAKRSTTERRTDIQQGSNNSIPTNEESHRPIDPADIEICLGIVSPDPLHIPTIPRARPGQSNAINPIHRKYGMWEMLLCTTC